MKGALKGTLFLILDRVFSVKVFFAYLCFYGAKVNLSAKELFLIVKIKCG